MLTVLLEFVSVPDIYALINLPDQFLHLEEIKFSGSQMGMNTTMEHIAVSGDIFDFSKKQKTIGATVEKLH